MMFTGSERRSIKFLLQICFTLLDGRNIPLLTRSKFSDLKTVRLYLMTGLPSSLNVISSKTILSSVFQKTILHDEGKSRAELANVYKFCTLSDDKKSSSLFKF